MPTAKQVLERSVENLLSWKSYHYNGTSSLSVPGDKRLNSESKFRTVLKQNAEGGLDGYMVVTSPSYSYETYSFDGSEYTRVKGGDWSRVVKSPTVQGYGMVSAGARKIIARFADLAEDVKFAGETPSEYRVSLRMGKRYYEGAAAIAGSAGSHGSTPSATAGADKDTVMTLVVDKKDMTFNSVVMKDTTSSAPPVTILTTGTYSAFNEPVVLNPPAEALAAPEVSAGDAPPTRQPQ